MCLLHVPYSTDKHTLEQFKMHADSTNFQGLSKEESYEQLLSQLYNLLTNNWVSNLANASSLLWHHFHQQPEPQSLVNWAGFYVTDSTKSKLVLGPFQGKVACQEIKFGSGVCGAAAESLKPQLVKDVHQFKGHIACDGDTNSEIVVPILAKDSVLGVIDIDCVGINGFDEEDVLYLEKVAALLAPSLASVVV